MDVKESVIESLWKFFRDLEKFTSGKSNFNVNSLISPCYMIVTLGLILIKANFSCS